MQEKTTDDKLELTPCAFFEAGFDPQDDGPESHFQLMITAPRHEKLMMTALENAGALCYLPLERREKKYKKGRAVNHVPLFSTYVFLRNAQAHKEYLFTFTQHFRQLIDVPTAAREQLWQDLCALRQFLALQAPIRACDEIQVGNKVVIRNGPLKDMEGVVVQDRGSLRFVINVHILGKSVQTELDPADLKLI